MQEPYDQQACFDTIFGELTSTSKSIGLKTAKVPNKNELVNYYLERVEKGRRYQHKEKNRRQLGHVNVINALLEI